jgi:protocatechuate 3,4-dioxygenase beta subunit
MKDILAFTLLILLVGGCHAMDTQSSHRLIGGPCEGCEAVLEYADRVLKPEATLPDFNNVGLKLKLTGMIYENYGKTPATGVILYIYHTNQEGIYETRGDETGWARRHGYIRSWIKTDKNGRYTFYTLKPGSYPGRSLPAHIHGTILEPNGGYYWIDSWHFKGDPFLKIKEESEESAYGGSGVVELKREGDLLVAYRDIILGKNVPGYK